MNCSKTDRCRRLAGFAAFFLFVLLFLPGAVLASDASHYVDDSITLRPPAPVAELSSLISRLDGALERGDRNATTSAMAEVLDWKSRLSAGNLFFVSRILSSRAESLARAGKRGQAVEAARFATLVSPSDSSSWFSLARHTYQQNPGDFQIYLGHANRGITALYKDPLFQKVFAYKALSAALWGCGIGFLLFCFALVFVNYNPIVHDIQRIAPFELERGQAVGILALILTSVLCGMGVLAASCLLGLILAGYTRLTGKITLILFFAFFAALPPLILEAGKGTVLSDSRVAVAADHFMNEGWEPEEIKSLEEASLEYPDDTTLYYLLGSYYRKMGNYEQAGTYLQRSLALNDRNVHSLVEVGNIHFGKGEYSEAEKSYKNALGLSPALFEAHYNLSKTYIELFRTDEAQAELDEASRINPEKTKLLVASSAEKNPVKVISVLPKRELPKFVRRTMEKEGRTLTRATWNFFMPFIPIGNYTVAVALYVTLFALAVLAWGKYGAHTLCSSCGMTFYPYYSEAEKGGYKCNRCVALASSRRAMVLGPKEKALAGIRLHQANRREFSNVLNSILPGFGSAWYGAHLRGAILLVGTGIFIGKLFEELILLIAGYRPELPAIYIAWITGMVVYYLVTIPFTWRRR